MDAPVIPPGQIRAYAAFLADLTAVETPAARFLRENRDAIRRAVAEMDAEKLENRP